MSEHLRKRPDPFPDESIRGYMIRLAKLNKTTPRSIYQKASLMTGNVPKSLLMITDKVSLLKLQELTMVDESKLIDLSFYSLAGRYGNEEAAFNILSRISISGVCSTSFSQICPMCLEEKSYHRKIWEIRTITTCHIHQCRLVYSCPKCMKPISPLRRFITHCNCGFDLRSCIVNSVSPTDILFSAHINERYFKKTRTTVSLREEFQQLSFRHFIYLHILFCYYFFKSDSHSFDVNYANAFKPVNIHQISIKTFQMFMGWPNKFYEFIESYRKVKKFNNESRVTQEFGSLHHILIRHLSSKEFSFVLDTLVQHCENGMTSDPVLKRVKQKIIKSINNKEKKDEASLDNEDFIGISKAAELLSIKRWVVEELNKHGILRLVRGKGGQKYCTRKNINEIILRINSNSLREKGPRKKRDEQIIHFSSISKIIKSRISIAKFISFALEGKILACGVDDNDQGLSRFSFFVSDIEQLISNGTIPIDEAAQQLNVTEGALRGWIKKGILKLNNESRFYSLNNEQIKKFNDQYMPLTELVNLHPHINLSLPLYSWLSSKSIYPVSGPQKDGSKAYLYKKDPKLLRVMGLESWN